MRHWLVAAGASLCAMNAPAFGQQAEDVFGDRGYALALDELCGLFDEAERAALEASYLQARGALLRADYTPTHLNDYRAGLDAEAARQPCNSDGVAAVKARVETAYMGYQRLYEIDFPGDNFSWQARRADPAQSTQWLVSQETDRIRAGIVRQGEQQAFTVTMPESGTYASVILVLRDTGREPELYDPTVGGLFAAPDTAPWARWTPPEYARRFVWAAGRLDAGELYALTGSESGTGYRFPQSAADEIASRDPRETARIDFMDRRGERVLSHYFEIGDFGAALAFLRATQAPMPGMADSSAAGGGSAG